jgi:hypothetical protein
MAMTIDELIPTDGSVLVVSARMVDRNILWATTEVSLQLWQEGPRLQMGEIILHDLCTAEKLALERTT